MIDITLDNRHEILVVLDYRVAYTVISGLRMELVSSGIVNQELNKWIDQMEKILDKGVQKSWNKKKCRRKGDRRK